MAANGGASVGGLFLQVKLKTDQVEADLKRLGRQFDASFNTKTFDRLSAALTRQARIAENVSRQQATAVDVSTRQRALAEERAAARAQRAAIATTKTQVAEAGKAAASVEAAANKKALAEEKAARRTTAAQKQAAKEASRTATLLKGFGAGSQELFVGLGAARSGNYFYGLAAGARYLKNLNAALSGLSPLLRGATVGFVGGTAAVAAYGAAVMAVTYKIGSFGVQQAANLQMLETQLTGLLGSADRARSEMDFLLQLGKEATVPTQSLIEADRQLLAFGVTADGTRRSLVQFFADFGTATGATEQQVYFLSLALGQVAAIGKANTVDMRQLANAGVNTMELYKIIGDEIGMSARKVAEGVSDGLITSQLLFAALAQYGTRFTSTAEAARKSTIGLMSNIRDTVTTEMGRAFAGVNEQIAGYLSGILTLVNQINFRNVAQAIGNVITYFDQVFRNFGVSSGDLVNTFNVTLPNAINQTGYYLARFVGIAKTTVDIMLVLAQTIVIVADSFASLAFGVGVLVSGIGVALGNNTPQDVQRTMDAFNEFRYKTSDDIAAVIKRIDEMNAAWDIDPIKQLTYVVTPLQAAVNSGQVPKAALQGQTPEIRAMLNQVQMPQLPGGGGAGGGGGGGSQTNPAIEAAKKWIEQAKKLTSEAGKAFEDLAKAAGLTPDSKLAAYLKSSGIEFKSALTEAFSSGNVNTILQQFNSLRENIVKAFAPFTDPRITKNAQLAKQAKAARDAQINALRADTQSLLALVAQNQAAEAKFQQAEKDYTRRQAELNGLRASVQTQFDAQRRKIERSYEGYYEATSATQGRFVSGSLATAQSALDSATSAYEAAKSKLDSLIEARDSFLSSIKDTLRSFVNTVTETNQEIQKYTRLDAVGSFALTTTSEADLGSFREGLQKRLDALKQWRQQVQQLMAAGLDSTLLQDLVAQGPDGSGPLVAALAGASSGEIAAINGIQSQLAAEVASVQSAASAQWFDAGISAQQAFTAPLEAAYNSAKARVEQLTAEKEMALGILDAWFADQNAAIDVQQTETEKQYDDAKKALEATLTANATAAETIALRIENRLLSLSSRKNPKGTWASGVAAMQGLIDGMNSKEGAVLGTARRIANAAAEAIRDALRVASPSKVTRDIGQMVGVGLAVGMESTLPRIADASARVALASLPGVSMTSVSSTSGLALAGAAALNNVAPAQSNVGVRVFIGETELTDIVRTEINTVDAADAGYVLTGRRL